MKHFVQKLGLDEDASWNEIREEYKTQVRVWHPDRFSHDPDLQKKAEEAIKSFNYALRRLEEMKRDIEALGRSFDNNQSFLEQYFVKTNGARGGHGQATVEDRREGYLQRSFAHWGAVASQAWEKGKLSREHAVAIAQAELPKALRVQKRKSQKKKKRPVFSLKK